jgi:hypothetical protein
MNRRKQFLGVPRYSDDTDFRRMFFLSLCSVLPSELPQISAEFPGYPVQTRLSISRCSVLAVYSSGCSVLHVLF